MDSQNSAQQNRWDELDSETFIDYGRYFHFDPEDVDKPSPLFDQLQWLQQAGFIHVDVYWMYAGHAIFGNRKPAQ